MARFYANHDVHHMVLELLSIQELRTYGLVCERTYEVVKQYLRTNATVVSLLTSFIDKDNIRAFRRMQRATGAIIGGSAALQFFTRQQYLSSDLDLYVHTTYVGKVSCALKKMHCTKTPRNAPLAISTQHGYVGQAIKEVIDFTTMRNRKIQLIVTRRRPVDVILDYHSTTVMNFLTGWYAYSLYGRETLQLGVAMYNPNSSGLPAVKSKWEARGWTEVASQSEAVGQGVFEATTRAVGDDQSCIVKLSSDGAKGDSKYRDTAIREASWTTGFNSNGAPYIFTM